MHLFDSARPSSHHHHEIQTSSPRSFFVSESSRAWQPLSPPGFDPTLARSKQHRRRRCSPPRRHRCCPGAKVFSPATEARAPAPMLFFWRRFLKAPMFIKLPLLLRGSSEDSAKSEDHDATSQKRNTKENQYVDTKEPMKAFHAFFSCHALNLRDLGRNTFGCLWFVHHFQCEISTKDFSDGAKKIWPQRSWLTESLEKEGISSRPRRSGSSGISNVKPETEEATQITDRRIICMAPCSLACLSWRLEPTKKIIQ